MEAQANEIRRLHRVCNEKDRVLNKCLGELKKLSETDNRLQEEAKELLALIEETVGYN